MFYEQIPNIVTSTVQALYRGDTITFDTAMPARVFEFVRTNGQISDLKTLLSQVGLVASVALALFIIFVMMQKRALKSQQPSGAVATTASGVTEATTGALRDRWNELLTHLESTHEAQWKMAVIEADKLVDDALAKAGFSGDTFGDRLSNIQPGTLLSLDGIWWAHKVRNRLAHEVDYFLRYTEARQAIGYFEAALAELQLI